MQRLVDILSEPTQRLRTPIESVGGYLASSITQSLISEILLVLEAFTVEEKSKDAEVLASELINLLAKKQESTPNFVCDSELLHELSRTFLCELQKTLEQHVRAESFLLEEISNIAKQFLEFKEVVDADAESIMDKKDTLGRQIKLRALIQIDSRILLILQVLEELMALKGKRDTIMAYISNANCTQYLTLLGSYNTEFVALVLLAQTTPEELHKHLPPLPDITDKELQEMYHAELLLAADNGCDAVIDTIVAGITLMPSVCVNCVVEAFITSLLRRAKTLNHVLWTLLLLYKALHEVRLSEIRDSLMCTFSAITDEIAKAVVRLKSTQDSTRVGFKDISNGLLCDMIITSMIQQYAQGFMEEALSMTGVHISSLDSLMMAIMSCKDGLILSNYMRLRNILVDDLFSKKVGIYTELLDELEPLLVVFFRLQQVATLDRAILLKLCRTIVLPESLASGITKLLISYVTEEEKDEKNMLLFQSFCSLHSQTFFHRRGSYHIHKTDNTRSIVDCAMLIDKLTCILNCSASSKAVILADGLQFLAFNVLLFHIKKEPRVPYTPVQCTTQGKFLTYANGMYQRLNTSLLSNTSLIGPGSEHTLLTVLREYSSYKHNLFLSMKRFTSITDSAGITLRQGIAGTAEELDTYYVLQNLITTLSSDLQKQVAQHASQTNNREIEEGDSDNYSDIFATGSYNQSVVTSIIDSSVDSSIQSMKAVYDAIEFVIRNLIGDELYRNFNLLEIMNTTIKSAAAEYRKEGKVDRANKTVYSSKLIALLKTNFYALQFGILATPSTASVPSTDSVFSTMTPSVTGCTTCSLFSYQFYNAFTIYACNSFITAASSIQAYTAYGRTCLMHDYCTLHGFLNTTLPEFCLNSAEIQYHFERVRSYINLYFGTPDDIKSAAKLHTFTTGQLISLIKTGLVHHLNHNQTDALVLALPGASDDL